MSDFLFIQNRKGFFSFRYPEVATVLILLAFALVFSWQTGAPFVVPDPENTGFIGLRYSFPLGLGAIWLGISFLLYKRRQRRGEGTEIAAATNKRYAIQAMLYFVTFSAVMWLHFNIKLWAPLINPRRFDELYHCIDEALAPLLDLALEARDWVGSRTGDHVDSWYLLTFAFMFFISFAWHLFRNREGLRNVFLAVLFIEALGPLTYLIAPAAGPFLYGNGQNLIALLNEQAMWEIRELILQQGPAWIAAYGDRYLSAGLAAMPSLHAGAAYIFVHYAVKYRTPLLPAYIVMYGWILIEALASKWHYLIDLPVGIALALFCIWLSNRFCQEEQKEEQKAEMDERKVPSVA
jgi:hypothetical protein